MKILKVFYKFFNRVKNWFGRNNSIVINWRER